MPYCPYCGAQDYGTPFCPSCQRPIPREGQPAAEAPPSAPAQAPAELRPAPFWRRLFALAADYAIVGIMAEITQKAYELGFGRPANGEGLDVSVSMGFSALMILLYFTLLTGGGGQTLAKSLLDIRVVRTDGRDVSYGRALARALGYGLFFPSLSLSFLWALWDRRRQAWHDKIADTIVVRV